MSNESNESFGGRLKKIPHGIFFNFFFKNHSIFSPFFRLMASSSSSSSSDVETKIRGFRHASRMGGSGAETERRRIFPPLSSLGGVTSWTPVAYN